MTTQRTKDVRPICDLWMTLIVLVLTYWFSRRKTHTTRQEQSSQLQSVLY